MHLVERLCTRIGIMINGSLAIEDTPEGLCERFDTDNVEDAFILAVGGTIEHDGLGWLHGSPG